jgi:hypothetical protein
MLAVLVLDLHDALDAFQLNDEEPDVDVEPPRFFLKSPVSMP